MCRTTQADVVNLIRCSAGAIAVRRAGDGQRALVRSGLPLVRIEGGLGVHVIGDAIQTAPLMPKSGHMANQHGKVAAAAVVAMPPATRLMRPRCIRTPATALPRPTRQW